MPTQDELRQQRRAAQVYQEMCWRLECRESLVTYARSIPIPGVPQGDNYDELQIAEKLFEQGDIKWDDGRFDDQQYINKIETDLAEHHELILNTCQDMVEGKLITPDDRICRRVMLFFPPGSAKSTYASVVFPTWHMGKYPDEPIILGSYADMLAKKHGKRARQVCMSPEYKAIFETQIDPTMKAADNWAVLNGSEYLAAGLQSGLTGNRAGGLIIDDPVKGRRAAESTAEQKATWDAYKDDARTRKKPGAWELLIQTRWSEKDLAGQILPEDWAGESGYIKCRDGNWWYVLCVQAQVEHEGDPLGREVGEYLWEEWFNEDGSAEDYWAPMKIDARSWASLHQQIPTPPEGEMFKQKWVQYYDRLPGHCQYYISADYAVTRDQDASDPDWTVIGVWAVSPEKNIYFVDGWKGKTQADVWIENALDLAENYEPMAHIAGGGPVRRGTEPFLKRRRIDRGVMVRLVWYPETHGKEENARSFQAMMSSGLVYWPQGNELAEWVIRDLIGFPTLTHDDGFDMCSMLGRHLAKVWGKKVKREKKEQTVITPQQITVNQLVKSFDRRKPQERW